MIDNEYGYSITDFLPCDNKEVVKQATEALVREINTFEQYFRDGIFSHSDCRKKLAKIMHHLDEAHRIINDKNVERYLNKISRYMILNDLKQARQSFKECFIKSQNEKTKWRPKTGKEGLAIEKQYFVSGLMDIYEMVTGRPATAGSYMFPSKFVKFAQNVLDFINDCDDAPKHSGANIAINLIGTTKNIISHLKKLDNKVLQN